MRILFLGSGAFGLPTLRALAAQGSGHEVVGVVTQPDRPAGRDRKLTPTPIGAFAAEHLPSVPLFKPEDINDPSVIERLRALGGAGADIAWVVIAYGQKLSRPLIDNVFAVNLHGSLLPRWRGAAPINHAILAGDAVTGNSVITIADRMDAGLVLAQTDPPIPIESHLTAGELHDLLADDGPRLIFRVLAERAAGTLRPHEQDESLVTRAKKLFRADAWVDFAADADWCRCRIHGLTPWPGVTIQVTDPRGTGVPPVSLKLLRVQAIATETHQPAGALIDPAAGLVQCGPAAHAGDTPAGPSALRLLEVQPAGKRPMTWSDFVRGHAILPGAIVRSEVPPQRARSASEGNDCQRRAK